ncbi:hypothetical protein ACCO45_007775 [Purpureocillium lilacinum]|uniref:Uncharacterized protein n=1 Tax=Purpureocillium lilacinum TaxID=33203 RepID=A0ACC4DMY6_PURLI
MPNSVATTCNVASVTAIENAALCFSENESNFGVSILYTPVRLPDVHAFCEDVVDRAEVLLGTPDSLEIRLFARPEESKDVPLDPCLHGACLPGVQLFAIAAVIRAAGTPPEEFFEDHSVLRPAKSTKTEVPRRWEEVMSSGRWEEVMSSGRRWESQIDSEASIRSSSWIDSEYL